MDKTGTAYFVKQPRVVNDLIVLHPVSFFIKICFFNMGFYIASIEERGIVKFLYPFKHVIKAFAIE